MNKSLGIFATMVTLTATTQAQEPAESISTSGTAELKRASEQMVAPGSSSIAIRLPTTVNKGEVISIQYTTSGNTIADSFMVTGITISGTRCTIESKHSAVPGAALSDMIYVQPCSKIR